MKRILVIALVFTIYHVKAQEQKGIKFVQGLSWSQIKERAKAENKYIFLDGFTTWCGPCKQMAREIFPQPTAGEFFNKNFINVAVQFDVTKNDNEDIKRWYKDAEELKEKYKINSYPTYLFFNPAGELVHTVNGMSSNADEFISKAAMALNPQLQFHSLKKQYENGNRSNEFLLRLINTTKASVRDEKFLRTITNEYLSGQDDLLKAENINFIIVSTKKSTDPGFLILLNAAEKIDSVAGRGKSADMVNEIVFDEIVLPIVRNGGAKISHAGGIITYIGTLKKDINWTEIEDKISIKYPKISERIIMASKPTYYDWADNWPDFANAVSNYILKYSKELSNIRLNFYANRILYNCPEPVLIKTAIKWAETILLEEPRNLSSLYTYACLLYKSGDKEKAIETMNQAVDISGDTNGGFADAITKINKGEKLW